MHRELLLLGLLRQQASHGYQLNEFIDQALSACTDLKRPTAYFLLDKMAAAGWLEATRSPASGRRLRRVFKLTAAGEAEFQRLLRENLSAWLPAYFPGDVGLAFADALPAAEARRLLADRRAALVEALAAAQRVPTHAGSLQWVVDHQARHLAAELDWLDSRLAQLKARSTRRPRSKAT
jgi:DNA-binding PadR family transcriptional regulator